MVISRGLKTVKKLTYSTTPDEYGQLRQDTPTESNVQMFTRIYTQTNVDNPIYNDVEMIGLTKDNTITVKNQILIGDIKYSVLHIIPSERWNQVLMRKA